MTSDVKKLGHKKVPQLFHKWWTHETYILAIRKDKASCETPKEKEKFQRFFTTLIHENMYIYEYYKFQLF